MTSEFTDLCVADIAFETSERYGTGERHLPVFGVQKDVGLTPEARYVSKDLSRYKCIRPGDFAYNPMRLNIGSIGMCKPEHGTALVSPDYVTFRLSSRVLPQFFNYLISTPQWSAWTSQAGTGSVRSRIYFSQLGTMKIRIPPLENQAVIVSMLEQLESGISNLAETNTTLEAIAQAIFKSWFIDFDPVKAKSEGRVPDGIDETTAVLFPDSFEESALGAIPKGWRALSLGEAYEINPTRKLKRDVQAPYVDMASLRTQGHVIDGFVQRLPGSGAKFMNGDTLLARITPCLENGKTAFVDFLADGEVGWGSTEFITMRPKFPLPDFHAYLLCRHQPFREHAIRSMSGTSGRQRVQNDQLANFLVAVPSQPVADAFRELTKAIQELIAANHQESKTLAELRDTLLPRLISGKLKLPELQELAEAL